MIMLQNTQNFVWIQKFMWPCGQASHAVPDHKLADLLRSPCHMVTYIFRSYFGSWTGVSCCQRSVMTLMRVSLTISVLVLWLCQNKYIWWEFVHIDNEWQAQRAVKLFIKIHPLSSNSYSFLCLQNNTPILPMNDIQHWFWHPDHHINIDLYMLGIINPRYMYITCPFLYDTTWLFMSIYVYVL